MVSDVVESNVAVSYFRSSCRQRRFSLSFSFGIIKKSLEITLYGTERKAMT